MQRIEKVVARENIWRMTMSTKNQFYELEDFSLFTLKIHMLDHLVEAVSRFGAPKFLNASPIENFYYVIEIVIQVASMQSGSAVEGGVQTMNSSVAFELYLYTSTATDELWQALLCVFHHWH